MAETGVVVSLPIFVLNARRSGRRWAVPPQKEIHGLTGTYQQTGVFRSSGKIDATRMVVLAPPEMLSQLKAYLRQILGFIGIEDVQTVRAEGMNILLLAIHAVPTGEKTIAALVF